MSRRSTASRTFKSTLPQGERRYLRGRVEPIRLFKSTLPQGERPYDTLTEAMLSGLNPRSHKGSDIFHG